MCAWLEVSKSGYYEWFDRSPSDTERRRELLKIKILPAKNGNPAGFIRSIEQGDKEFKISVD